MKGGGARAGAADLGGAWAEMSGASESAVSAVAILDFVVRHYGLEFEAGPAESLTAGGGTGLVDLSELLAIADRMSLAPRIVHVPEERLGNLHLPAVLECGGQRFVVVDRVKRTKARVYDPRYGLRWVSRGSLAPSYTGTAVELRPVNRFESHDDAKRFALAQIWRRTTGVKASFAKAMVLSVISLGFILASPFFMQLAVDFALPATDYDLLATLALGFALLVLTNAAALLLRGLVLQSSGSMIGFDLSSNIAHKLLRLPIAWFERGETGDILSRLGSVEPIKVLLSEGTARVSFDGIFATLLLAIMFLYSWKLAAIVVIALALVGLVRLLSYQRERDAEMAALISSGRDQGMAVETLKGLTTLRLSGSEIRRHSAWLDRLLEKKSARERLGRIRVWQLHSGTLIFGLENVLTTWLAVMFVMDGAEFTIGMIFAFKAYRQHFVQSSTNLIEKCVGFRMLALHLDRLSRIAASDTDRIFRHDPRVRRQLEGRLELRNISFCYPSSDRPAVSSVDLLVERGEHVAITGPSGGGKSTLLKIMLGLFEPVTGQVLIDGLPLERFGFRNYHRQIAAVLQDDTLFAGTLAENIALFDDMIDMDRVVACASAAAVHADIMAMPQQYESAVWDMGSAMSGGQRQRILLARALYRRPKILFMDEGTSHLDSEHERAVNEAIEKLGITRIIVAHREETIKAAHRVIQVRGGRLVESPTSRSVAI